MKKKVQPKWLATLIALFLLVFGTVAANLVRTSGGKVELIEMTIPDKGGSWIHATVFKPKTATEANKAPVVVTCHGYSDSGEKQDFAAIELSRRGFVVFEMDALSHGLSGTSTIDSSPGSTMGEGCGMIALIDYISSADSHISYIDTSRIGVTGHSMGGIATTTVVTYYGGLENAALAEAAKADSDGGTTITAAEKAYAKSLNKVAAAIPQSAIPSPEYTDFSAIKVPFALCYGYYDEGNYSTLSGNGDMRTAPEALATVNAVLPEGKKVTEVEIGKEYGSLNDGTYRVVYNPKTAHTYLYLTPEVGSIVAGFFMKTLGQNSTIPATNTVFLWRFIFSGLGLLGLVMLIPFFASALLETKFFKDVKQDAPEAKMELKTKGDKAIFWGIAAFLTIFTVVLLVPTIKLDAKIFPVVAAMGYAKIFTSVNVNSFMIWDVVYALVVLAIFLVLYFVKLKKQGWTVKDLGLKVTGKQLLKIVLLAIAVMGVYYAVVFTVDFVFNVDLRAWAISAKTFNLEKVSMWLQYLPGFFLFFAVQALVTNTINRVKNQKNNLLVNVLINVAGLAIIAIFAYSYLYIVGVSFPAWQTAWDRVMQCIPFAFFAASSTIITRKCYEKTGSIWAGAFINAFIITMMLVVNTSEFLLLAA